MVALTLEALLLILGSVSVALTLALLVSVPARLELRTTVICALALSAKLPKVHVSVPVATLQLPCEVVLET